MRLFPILFAFDALGLLGLVWFFLDGLRNPSSGGDYMGAQVARFARAFSRWVPARGPGRRD